MKRPSTGSERGFALLIVFLMAAVVAFSLYRQLPRVAFESQRDKEELLMERGEQFKRAIQLFVVANKRYPAKIEDLENTNDKRYLRRRYIDPLTGKDEWRLIHVNAAGLLTDSLVQKPPPLGGDANKNQLAGNQPFGNPLGGSPLGGNQPGGNPLGGDLNANGVATNQQGQPQPVNNAVLRRPSDRSLVPDPGGFAAPGFAPNGPEPSNDPSQWPAITLQPPAQAGGQGVPGQAGLQPGNPQFNPQLQFPGQFQPGQQQPGQQVTPGQQFPGQQFPGQPFPGQPFTPGQPIQGQQPVDQQFGQAFPGQAQQNGALGAFPPGLQGQIPGQPGFNPQLANQNNLGQNNPVQFPVTARIGPDGQFIPVTNQPGQPINTQTGGVLPAPGQPQFPQGVGPGGGPPGGPGTAPNTALDLINKLLTSPSQNVPAGVGNNNTVAGGIAGVASTYQGPSIKVYKERQKYNEWEFVFDLKSTQPNQPPQTPGGGPPGTPPPTPGK